METLPPLYVHPARPSWGRGLVVAVEDGRPRLAFEDGATRLLQSLDLLERVVLADDEARSVVEALVAKPKSKTTKVKSTKPSKGGTRFASFEAQVERFLQLFPKGFEDPRYVAEERQVPNAKGTLRHRAGAMAYAAEMLSPDAIGSDLATDPSEVHRKACRAIGRSTNLLFHIDARRFRALPSEHHATFAGALRTLLADDASTEEAIATHFDHYVDALAVSPRATWPMATLHLALVRPERFLLVQPKYLTWQAALFAMEAPAPGLPSAAGYRAALTVAREVERRLRAAGLAPRDLMDVQIFINRTHRSKAPDSQ